MLQSFAKDLVRKRYKRPYDKDEWAVFKRACKAFSDNREHYHRLLSYAHKRWFCPASPILSNAPFRLTWGDSFENNFLPERFDQSTITKAMPISCFLSYVSDSIDGLLKHTSESRYMSVCGGGVGFYIGDIRAGTEGSKSPGPIPFLKTYDSDVLAYHQASCYSEDVEVLTDKGWKLFKELQNNDRVAQVHDDLNVSFVKPIEIVISDYEGELVTFKDSKNINISVTPNHNMVFKRRKRKSNKRDDKIITDELYFKPAENQPLHRDIYFLHSGNKTSGKEELSYYDRFRIAYQADGTPVNKGNQTQFRFSKLRKVKRLQFILDKAGIEFTVSKNKDDSFTFYVKHESPDKEFNWINIEEVSSRWAEEFIFELMLWDGSVRKENISGSYYNKNKRAIDKVQALASIAGFKSRASKNDSDNCYTLFLSKGELFGTDKIEKIPREYSGKVYCVIIPTHRLIVRSNGHTLVCGNTRRSAYAVYMDVSHPDIEEFLAGRSTSGGDVNRKFPNIHHGINITWEFLKCVRNDQLFPLIDPHTGATIREVKALDLWLRILETRHKTGEPYLLHIDSSNEKMNPYLKEKGLSIKSSNLCQHGHH